MEFSEEWQQLIKDENIASALQEHFFFWNLSPELEGVRDELFAGIQSAKIEEEKLNIYFGDDTYLSCSPPFSGSPSPKVPKSYADICSRHNQILLHRNDDIPLAFYGLDASGELFTSDLATRSKELMKALEKTESDPEAVPLALYEDQDSIIFHPYVKTPSGEPALTRIDHGSLSLHPLPSTLHFGEIFFCILAGYILGRDVLPEDSGESADTIRIGKKTYPLTTLEISLIGEDITELPSEIGRLVELEELDLGVNKIPVIPPEIGKLTNLLELGLASNRIETLPEAIGKLENLRDFSLMNNQLTSLPSSIGNLARLEELDLSRNPLHSLPEEIGDLQQLRRISISSTYLKELPDSLRRLTKLEELFLKELPLSTLPDCIGELQSLQELSIIAFPNLTSLPASIGRLLRLGELLVSGCKNLSELPEEIANVPLQKFSGRTTSLSIPSLANLFSVSTLREITLDQAGISVLPKEIQELKSLETLQLGENKIHELPAQIEGLQSLTHFYISENALETVPPEIGKLQKLEVLHLGGNPIRHLPDEIGQLKNLKRLILDDCPLESDKIERVAELLPETKILQR